MRLACCERFESERRTGLQVLQDMTLGNMEQRKPLIRRRHSRIALAQAADVRSGGALARRSRLRRRRANPRRSGGVCQDAVASRPRTVGPDAKDKVGPVLNDIVAQKDRSRRRIHPRSRGQTRLAGRQGTSGGTRGCLAQVPGESLGFSCRAQRGVAGPPKGVQQPLPLDRARILIALLKEEHGTRNSVRRADWPVPQRLLLSEIFATGRCSGLALATILALRVAHPWQALQRRSTGRPRSACAARVA